ncbi:hypothetical protein AB1K83_08730 [Sporosarcina sp. 179-K 3D1 HS]|uniref:hypothetical protein n=1 Tax=Sporosarcina sp. 179-K 3D1 HS TaxID=3232169 RepID=UPI0039A33C2C
MLKKTTLLGTVLALGITGASLSYPVHAQQPTAPLGIAAQQEKTTLEERLLRLEEGIIPKNPDETVSLWAKAVKERNGALQYALFDKVAKSSAAATFEQYHWVTGASSPWVETYQVIQRREHEDKSLEYVVEFDVYTSSGKTGKDQARLSLSKQGDKWVITGLGPAYEESLGIWNTPESINETAFDKNSEQMKTYKSQLGYELHLPKNVMGKLKMKETVCENEEGSPSCTNFYYQDAKTKKQHLLMSMIRLTKEQETSDYYQDHPFLKWLGKDEKGSFYQIFPSEHPYGDEMNSPQGTEWSHLVEVLKERRIVVSGK